MRTKRERLNNTYKHIGKRLNIIEYNCSPSWRSPVDTSFIEQPHRLNKNKVEGRYSNQHTKNKTKRHIHGNYQRSRNYKPSDQRQIDAGEYVEN